MEFLRCWQYLYFLLIFCASHRTNYATEAFTLLTQEMFLLSPKMAFQLKWCHTVNTHDCAGKNISVDMHMEHLNHECKNALSTLGSNMTDYSVKRVGRCIGEVVSILYHFDQANAIPYQSGYHPHCSLSEDIKQLLTTSSVFTVQEGRYHCTFQILRVTWWVRCLHNINHHSSNGWRRDCRSLPRTTRAHDYITLLRPLISYSLRWKLWSSRLDAGCLCQLDPSWIIHLSSNTSFTLAELLQSLLRWRDVHLGCQ